MSQLEALSLLPNLDRLEALPDLGREAWLTERSRGIGGSDVAAILGISPWATPLSVWRRKRGLDPDTGPTWAMKCGTAMESTIADTWAQSVGARLLSVPFLRDRESPHRVASLDRLAVFPSGEVRATEVKWSSRGLDEVPAWYLTQVIWYLRVTGLRVADLVVGGPWDEPHSFEVRYDPDLAADIEDAVDRFWFDNVLANVAPAPTTPDERKGVALQRLAGLSLETVSTPEADAIVSEIRAAKEAEKRAEEWKREREATLLETLARSGATKMRGHDWSASVTERVGAVRYSEVCKSLGVAQEMLDRFRGEPSRFLTVRDAKPGKGG